MKSSRTQHLRTASAAAAAATASFTKSRVFNSNFTSDLSAADIALISCEEPLFGLSQANRVNV
jgi:hypothetical protein